MVLQAVGDHGTILGSTPTEAGLEQFDGRAIEVGAIEERREMRRGGDA